ncbi:type IV pilus assembly protein PilB [Ferrimonas sediminum]|uniref:Type IV pilus assembly protein PilB n=1 Tax=Ferrimonas sediminum TaxID=718193 RepID=A0A1G8KH53_9GAMM|nr:type IV-A pilus assembly ATPase PilB [Ferrimonas sediminum]SDI42747.1 type IV pilus assembly protein PilB [Ferrimonas sediminum]
MDESLYRRAVDFGTPLFDIQALNPDNLPGEQISVRLVEQYRCLPIGKRGQHLFVATSDPANLTALEDFEFNTGHHVIPILVAEEPLGAFIDGYLENDFDALELSELDEQNLGSIEVDDGSDAAVDDPGPSKDDAPIVIYINKLLTDAIKRGASDLHFEPYEKEYRIRFRIDGVLHPISSPPVNLASRISARLKVMSKLDIAERRLPQDGRIKLRLGRKKSIDFRVSTLPTLFGEKIVMRILDGSAALLNIDALGYEPDQKARFCDTLARPQGMILVTGPTGSGKTVSLYTGLNILNTAQRNISTAEDPVEINLNGINQVQINNKAGLSFATALRAFLRQDPDVVMVGEIRDLETAEIAIKAAQTGHLVLSTLHTNSAAETLTRLQNMGVAPYNIAASVSLIIAQRLCRRLCPHCKQPESLPQQVLTREGFSREQVDGGLTLYRAVGCSHCTGGFKGRLGVYELMPMNPALAELIMAGGTSLALQALARKQGMVPLRESGLAKVAQGLTSLAEINRITSF